MGKTPPGVCTGTSDHDGVEGFRTPISGKEDRGSVEGIKLQLCLWRKTVARRIDTKVLSPVLRRGPKTVCMKGLT